MTWLGNGAVIAVLCSIGVAAFVINSGLTNPKQPNVPTPVGKPSDFVKNSQGIWLRIRSWLPKKTTPVVGAVYISHGFGEHSGRTGYLDLAERLNAIGFEVYAHDHQGHGESAGLHTYVEHFDDWANDLADRIAAVRKPGLPMFLLGHSMGAVASIRTVELNPTLVTGLVLSGAALHVDEKVATPTLKALARLLSGVVPRLAIGDPLDPAKVSRDRDAVARYVADPKVYKGAPRVRFGHEFISYTSSLDASKIATPVLLLHGAEDFLCKVDGSEKFYNEVSSKDKTLKVFPGGYHEMFEDPDKDQFFKEIEDWVLARVK